MDCITIKNLEFHSLHGYHTEEREKGNDFEVDVLLWVPLAKAAAEDNLSQTVDYSHAASIVRDIMLGESVKLIETLLFTIGESLIQEYPGVQKIEVAVRKLHPPMSPSCEYTEVRSQWPKL